MENQATESTEVTEKTALMETNQNTVVSSQQSAGESNPQITQVDAEKKPQSDKLPEFLIDYTPDDDEEKFPEYIRITPVKNEEFFGTGIRINTGVTFTIKPEDAEAMGNYLLDISEKLKVAGEIPGGFKRLCRE